jgi:hypothetical protein
MDSAKKTKIHGRRSPNARSFKLAANTKFKFQAKTMEYTLI